MVGNSVIWNLLVPLLIDTDNVVLAFVSGGFANPLASSPSAREYVHRVSSEAAWDVAILGNKNAE